MNERGFSTLDESSELRSAEPQYYFLSSPRGELVEYYLGRETIVGSNYPIRPVVMRVDRLDKQTAVIIQCGHGKDQDDGQVVSTFELLDQAEVDAKRKELGDQGRHPDIISVSEDEMKTRVSGEYDWTRVVLCRADESEDAHLERLAKLFRVGNYFKAIRDEFFIPCGISYLEIPWREQLVIGNILLESDPKIIARFARKFGVNGLRTLAAAEYEPQIRDTVLSLTEFSPEQARIIFRGFARLRDASQELAKIMARSDFLSKIGCNLEDLDFAEQIQEAITRRGKDVLYTAGAVARGEAPKADVYGETVTCRGLDEVVLSLTAYAQAVETICDLVRGQDQKAGRDFRPVSQDQSRVPESYRFQYAKDDGQLGHLTIQLRALGAPLGKHNADLEFDGEARINFLFSEKPLDLDTSSLSRRRALSIRLDRECKQRSQGVIIVNDPAAEQGEASLDIGGFLPDRDEESPGSVLTRVISVGNALAQKSKTDEPVYPQYYHNRESFARELGRADIFEKMVQYVRRKIMERYPQV